MVVRILLAISLLAASGCGSAPPAGDAEPQSATEAPSGTAKLQVIVWSSESRHAVPATGTVATEGQRFDLDTRGSVETGQAFRNLAPGLYQIEVESRYESDQAFRVSGSENVYLEPGADEEVTVVAIDRPGNN